MHLKTVGPYTASLALCKVTGLSFSQILKLLAAPSLTFPPAGGMSKNLQQFLSMACQPCCLSEAQGNPMNFPTKVSLGFAAGCFGALLNSLTLWAFGALGINHLLGVSLNPALTPAFLYPRLVWGGLWGFLFLLPWRSREIYRQGLLYSLGPTLVQLFVVFPYRLQKGFLGLELGLLTPLLVIIFNAVWGLGTVWWLRRAARDWPR